MTHCVKIQLPTSDMFVYKLTDTEIEYEIRDGEGKLMEARNTSKTNVNGDKLYFDKRFIAIPLAAYCAEILV